MTSHGDAAAQAPALTAPAEPAESVVPAAPETPAASDAAGAPAGPVEAGAAGPACAVPSVRDLLGSCAAARTVSTPPSGDEERRAAPERPEHSERPERRTA
jgi:hypothetical protein